MQKGVDIAIEIARRRLDVSFIFVRTWTDNPEQSRLLRRVIRSLGNITLLPNQADLGGILQATRILLMPSRCQEAWGRTVTEAQLCGIPVLGSNRGQLPQTIGPGGIVLDPDAAISVWLQAFDSIWSDEARYRALSCQAKKHAARLIEEKNPAIERFENCLISAINRERLASSAFF
jgi:glycosyltransferase involved in cell wall biosynthesis